MKKQISLRPITLADVSDKYLRWLNDPEVTQYTEQRFYLHTKESIAQYVKSQLANPDIFFWAILRDEGHIGNIKLVVNRVHRRGEISLVLGEKKWWGKGHGTAAVKLVAEFAFEFLELHKLTAGCYDVNHGSRRIFEKNGFRLEGVYEKEYLYKGEYINALRFGLTRKEYNESLPSR